MKKKLLLTMVLICVGVLALGMLNVSAYYGTKYGDYLYYKESNGEIQITDCDESAVEIVIPETINGKKVTSIGKDAFNSSTALKRVTIPDSVTSIGSFAFCNCSGLTSIDIPSSVTSVGKYAFYGCSSVKAVYINDLKAYLNCEFENYLANPMYYANALYLNRKLVEGDLNIPEGVTQVPAAAFYGCKSLTSVTIADSITSIGSSAFYNCSNLTSITIPDSVTNIEKWAFYNCSGLTSIDIPRSVTSVGEYAFYGCSSVKAVYINDLKAYLNCEFDNVSANPMYYAKALYLNRKLVEGDLKIPEGVTQVPAAAFYGCKTLTSVTIPDGVTSIYDYAFDNCRGLTSVTIPDSVTSIGDYAFYYCESMTSIDIPSNVADIGKYAFSFCLKLTNVTISDGVTSIGDSAFSTCVRLTNITIPDSVTSIGNYAFGWCSSLINVYYNGKVSDWSKIEIGSNNDYLTNAARIYFSYTESNGEITIIDCDETAVKVVIPSKIDGKPVTNIGFAAFYNCSSLTSITIPETVTSIGKWAFYNCSSLASITIPDSVMSIGFAAFYNCSSLTSITIPDSVTSIDEYAFFCCSSLKSITVDEDNANYCSIDGNLFSKDEKELIQYAIGKPYTGYSIPNSVTSIGFAAFYNCKNLISVMIPGNVISIGDFAFYNCESLTSVTIPESVTKIGNGSFRDCGSLKTITIDEDNANYCSIDGNLFSKDKKELIQYAMGKTDEEYRIPDGVTSIGEYALYNCKSLTSVTIPDSVTSIEFAAFYECSSLKNVYYNGKKSDWSKIEIGSDNDYLTNATRTYLLSKVTVTVDGKETEVNGQIVLGAENTDGSYSLPENVVGYYVNDDFVDAGKYDVSDGDIITTVKFNVEIVNGAQVRYGGGLDENGKVGKGNGLRFIAQVDRSEFDGESYGMKIQAEASSNFTEVVADKWQDDTTFSVAITDMLVSNYNRNYTATPFVKVKYDDGTEKTVYGTNTVTRSIYKVSAGLLVSGYKESENGSIGTDYTMSEYLVRVLNAYVNQTGVRLTLVDNELVARTDENLAGAYTGDAFFNVGNTTYEDGKYTVTLTALGEAKIDTKLFNEYLRINNNNSQVKSLTEITDNGDGTYTIVFDYGSLGK